MIKKGEDEVVGFLSACAMPRQLAAHPGSAAYQAGFFFALAICVAVAVLIVIAGWRMFTKASRPGWAFLVPFYNSYVILRIAGRPGWWLVLLFLPIVNFVINVIIFIDLGASFGKKAWFGLFGLPFLSPIGYCVLGYGTAAYEGPAAANGDERRPRSPDPAYPAL